MQQGQHKRSFTDGQGREWIVRVDVAGVKVVRALGVDIWSLFGDDARRVFRDPVIQIDMLWLLCKQQAAERHMTDEDFGRIFADGDVIEQASVALLEAVIDFFPQSRREVLRRILTRVTELAPEVEAMAMQKVNDLTATDLLTYSESLAKSA